MTALATSFYDAETRARVSGGISNLAIYEMVERALSRRNIRGGCLIDVGCGIGNLYAVVGRRFDRCIGVDVIRYEGLPEEVDFVAAELNSGNVPLPDCEADVVVAVETIEHLENPRACMRQLVRLAKPGGWVLVTTPNQLSILSLLALVLKRRFVAFQDVHYPAHLTALLESDLLRIGLSAGSRRCELNTASSDELYSRLVTSPDSYPIASRDPCQTTF